MLIALLVIHFSCFLCCAGSVAAEEDFLDEEDVGTVENDLGSSREALRTGKPC